MSSWHRRDADGSLVILVHAQPGAKRTEVAGLHGESLKVRIAAPAVEDRANAALIEFIADRLGVGRREVTIVGGERSRAKRVRVACAADPARLLEA